MTELQKKLEEIKVAEAHILQLRVEVESLKPKVEDKYNCLRRYELTMYNLCYEDMLIIDELDDEFQSSYTLSDSVATVILELEAEIEELRDELCLN